MTTAPFWFSDEKKTSMEKAPLHLKYKMMRKGNNRSADMCTLCGEAFTLPEDEAEGNLPRALLCSHIYCTSCLLSIQNDDVITCPECKVDSILPEGGVFELQEDSGTIGLIYTSKINRKSRSSYPKKDESSPLKDINANAKEVEQSTDIEKMRTVVDEALVQAAKNHALLDKINETLKTGLADQVKRERARLEFEITQAADKASQAIENWKDEQMSQLTKLNTKFTTGRAELCRVQEKMKALGTAMQMAREVRRVPFLEQYCTLDKVLETLLAPVDEQSFDVKCITLGSGLSSVFQIDGLKPSLGLSLAIEVGDPKQLSEPPSSFNRKSSLQHAEGRDRNYNFPSGNDLPTHPKQNQESPRSRSPSSRGSFLIPKRLGSSNRPHQINTSHSRDPDLIFEELYMDQQHAPPPTDPELASDAGRIQRKKINQSFGNQADFFQLVIVTHIVNPSHFYVRYEAESSESENLSEKINIFCSRDSCRFTSSDKVKNGSLIFVKSKEGLWCRARVVSVTQIGRVDAGKDCPVTQLASVRVFFLDTGLNIRLPIQREEGSTESSLQEVNNQLRKVYEGVDRALSNFAPQAVRCSLKDLVPYDLTKGWRKDAQVKFSRMVGSAVVDMRHMGQDRDTLLVDLKKLPVNQPSGNPISVGEYLVLNEVARYYAPVNLGMRTLLFYPPDYPEVDTEVNAVVSHINTPTDFYIQVENMESLLLFAKLQDCYNATTMAGDEDFNIYCPVMEQACVALFKGKLWYRAQIIGNPAGKKVEVQYVDFGIKKILSVSNLRKIKDEFFALPSMAIHCYLSEIIPLDGYTWSETCCNRFVSLAQDKLVTIVATGPKSQPLPVKLFESSLNGPQANIATLLVKEELASFTDRSAPCRPRSPQETLWSSAEDSTEAIWDSPLELGLDTERVDTPEQKTPGDQTEEQPEFDAQLKLPDQLKDLKVRVSHVNSPSSFYVQFTQNDAQLKKICELVNKQCARTEAEDIIWKADIYCAAEIDGVWERGQICSDVESDNIAEVLRCDHGNKVKIHISDLRPLRPSLTGALALECSLTDIRPAGGRSTWTATACDLISFHLAGASAMVNIKELTDERPVSVILYCSNKKGRFVSIADFLVSEGLALKERKPRDVVGKKSAESMIKETEAQPPVSETQAKGSDVKGIKTPPALLPSHLFFSATPIPSSARPNSRTIMSAEKVKTPMYNPPELPCLGNIEINVSAIGEDGLIYTRALNADSQLEQLRERIQQSMKTLPRQKPYTWKSVLGCAVIGPDMLWYRGQLLEVLGGHVKVQYVDYGLVENIPVVHVYPVLLCEDVPQLCMPCKLHRINPVGGRWQRDAVALLKELLLDRCVDMRVMELPSDPRDPLSVELFVDGLSLSRILCHHDHASMDRSHSVNKEFAVMSPALLLDDWDIDTEGLEGPEEPLLGPFIYPILPQKGERIQVRVKHLWTPNELFLWPLDDADEVDGETLDEVLTRINSDLSSLQRLSNFRQGAPCLAEYRDGKYYRAELIEITSVEPVMILVKHVDFGSDDTLPSSKLRQMCAELMSFPSRALKVKVAGFKPPSKSQQQQQDVLPYSPTWSVKAAMDMIDMLHGNITACVVAREPELTVLLYNEDEELVHLPLVSNGLAEFE